MDHTVKINQESRQSEVMRNRRNNSSEIIDTTVNSTVNKISEIDINYITSRHGDNRFNSTMKPEMVKISLPETDQMTHSETTEDGTTQEATTKTSEESTSTRTLPQNQETTSSLSEKEIMRTLRNMIDFLKGKTDNIKRMPKVINPRGVNEVSEDSIANISIEEIQRILKEDGNTIYDTLVTFDYIKEVAEV